MRFKSKKKRSKNVVVAVQKPKYEGFKNTKRFPLKSLAK